MEHHGAVQAQTQLPPPASIFLQCLVPPSAQEAPGELQAVPEVQVVPLTDFSPLAGCPMHPASSVGTQSSRLCVALHPVRAIANIPIKTMRPPTVITVLMTVICDLLMNGLHCPPSQQCPAGFLRDETVGPFRRILLPLGQAAQITPKHFESHRTLDVGTDCHP